MALERFENGAVVVELHDTAREAALRMRDHRVGCVVVIRGPRPIGILTDRDLALRVVAEGRDPDRTLVSEIVTHDAVTIERDATIETAARIMKDRGVRRLPIVDADGRVTGIVTADDLVILLSKELANVGASLADNVESYESR